jgi:hypothetical protein
LQAVVCACAVAVVLNVCATITIGAVDAVIGVTVVALDIPAVAIHVQAVAVITVACIVLLIPRLATNVVQVVRLLTGFRVVIDPIHSNAAVVRGTSFRVDIAICNLS